jgi:hypothetical protein
LTGVVALIRTVEVVYLFGFVGAGVIVICEPGAVRVYL